MKKIFILFTLSFISILTFSQTEMDSLRQKGRELFQIDNLMQKGYQLHDAGKYNEAIEIYKEALKIDPKSSTIKYEIALSYMYAKDNVNAIKFSSEVIANNDENLLNAYNVKGSSLDNSGKTNEAIALYKEALKKFSTNYLLHYNLALTYFRIKQYNEAADAAIKALEYNSGHVSSHLILGYSMYYLGNKVPSLLALDYFLLLEPNTSRSKTALDLVLQQFKANLVDKNGKVTVYDNNLNKEFSSAELFLSLLAVSNSKEKNKSEIDLFAKNTTAFFKMLGESNKNENKDIWWNSYIPFFYQLAQSPHIETYCQYITQSTYPESKTWINNNVSKVKVLADWEKNGGK